MPASSDRIPYAEIAHYSVSLQLAARTVFEAPRRPLPQPQCRPGEPEAERSSA